MATVLVVDDRPVNREYLATLLGYGAHRVLEAADGTEALRVAHRERVDLIVTDVVMPAMDGFELVRHLRADPELAQTPVIFYTAHCIAPEAESLAGALGCRLLSKPADPEKLLRLVNQSLGQPRAPVSQRR